ncbi:MAG: 3-dehydroquinate dehydratase [Chloroflexi bacterium]|nr:3-dehydroquinate dehydratase [Chloroflexota bacterium]
MTKILVVHGAGMNMRGKVQAERFGPQTLDEYDEKINGYAAELGVEVEIFHSNIEGRVIDRFYEAHDGDVDAAVINPAGYTIGHPALAAAISQVRFPTIELHVSNPTARGNVSEIAPVCRGVVLGFGLFGYYLALRGALDLVSSRT